MRKSNLQQLSTLTGPQNGFCGRSILLQGRNLVPHGLPRSFVVTFGREWYFKIDHEYDLHGSPHSILWNLRQVGELLVTIHCTTSRGVCQAISLGNL